MKYTAAILAAAAGVAAMPSNVTVITEVVDHYTTYCPVPTTITHGTQTITVVEPTTVTFECPCTVTKPIVTTSTVICHDCPTEAPEPTVEPTPIPIPTVSQNTTIPIPTEEPEVPAPIPTAGAVKAAGLSGLVGAVGLAAFFL